MHIHEYQAKIILRKHGIAVPEFAVISDINEVHEAIERMGLDKAVIKIQVHAGGRGKAGGVKLAKTRQQILDYSQQLLGMKMVNAQTGPEGVVAHKILISPIVNYKKEYYAGAIIDRLKAQAVLIVSPDGGVEIEEVAHKTPERIMTTPISLDGTIRSYHLIELAKFMGWKGTTAEQGRHILAGLAKTFMECDASLLEINPLVETLEGDLLALDAKMSVDDNALYRQKQISSLFDSSQISPYEAQAKKYDLAYVALDGTIGCMVNGAGLAMATMDIIHHFGGKAANFLDVGGSATQDKIAEGYKILLSDPKVKTIMVNIFGGIMNCVTIAAGIIAAASEKKDCVPVVVRMEGTNVEQARKMLADSGLNIIIAKDIADAAQKAVAAAKR